jgi:histidinol-phosphate/aromatic aminotransferase/cobyric acid decarboxylase-like protein
MFAPDDDEKVSLLQTRYGGYWRYPQLLDFCYLVNPYYPNQKLMNEIKASFEKLLTQYPSGMRVNSLLAAKNFGVHQENILVGNGAAELIKALMERLEGKVGFIRPTFEEYPNRYNKEESVCYMPDNDCFKYDENDVMSFFDDKDIGSLVIVNPDNPSGNYISKSGLMTLCAWAAKKGIKLIIDESFVDFADEADNTLIDQKILDANKHLFVMKSISKSYGVPGLRLGVLASGDENAIADLKRDVAIWNINSFAEFYMQIEEKYKKDYVAALIRFREERARYFAELEKIPSIRVIPSQANYVMVELRSDMTSKELTKRLLLGYNLFVKDLSGKMGGKQYLRLAVRTSDDNNKLIEALRKELS